MKTVRRALLRHCQRPYLWLIKCIGLIVPRRLRADWREEWEAELRYREELLAEWDNLNWRTKLDLLRRSIGVIPSSFNLLRGVDVYAPIGQWNNPALQSRRAALGLHGIGRLKPGVISPPLIPTPTKATARSSSLSRKEWSVTSGRSC